MSIRLVKTPFAAPAYRDGGASALYSVDTNVPSSSTSTYTGPSKPKGPRKAFTSFQGGVLPMASPTTHVRDTPSASSSFPKRTPISHRRTSPYADAYPGKSPSTRPSMAVARSTFEAVIEQEEPEIETQENAGSHDARRYASITHRPLAALYKPSASGRSVLSQECSAKVDYSKQVAGMLFSRVNDGRIPRPWASRSRSYVKSGLSRVAVSF
ncbi:hypothetical protein CPB85DRAFT_1434301 [Mucidula mucida]|nr:hypothetical protein CPB85DRAFT_1434301 [Mucidula mucida]